MIRSIIGSLNRFYAAIALFMVYTIYLYSQTYTTNNLAQFLFPEFTKSVVKMKAGNDLIMMLNYNTITEKMVFLQNGQVYDMVNEESVDTIFLQNRRFVPYNDIFIDVVEVKPIAFFIQYKSSVSFRNKPPSVGTSQVSAANSYSIVNTATVYLNLELPAGFVVKSSTIYWVRVKNKMTSFLNEREFLKIFPVQANQIKKFIKEQRLKIKNREDLKALGNFCNELMK